MIKPSLLLISTTNASCDRVNLLRRMVESVDAFARARPELAIRLMLLIQEAGSAPDLLEPKPWLDIADTAARHSLSSARNLLLARAVANNVLREDDIVLFPDDDCWYPEGVLAGIVDAFARDDRLDLWFCRYGAKPVGFVAGGEVRANVASVTRRASSNTIAVRGRIVLDGLRFDERLGVGAPINGGEDTAFALSAFGRGRSAVFLDCPCIGHRDPNPDLSTRYFRGALVALAGHLDIPGVKRELGRKFIVGAFHTLRGARKPKELGQDLLIACSLAFKSRSRS